MKLSLVLVLFTQFLVIQSPTIEDKTLIPQVEVVEYAPLTHAEPLRSEFKPMQVTTPVKGDWVAQCHVWAREAGIELPPAAISLIDHESDCNPNARNSSSGACGIGQQLPCGKWPHKWNDPVGGLIDMYNYVTGRYGSWEGAWSFWLENRWY